MLSLCLPLLELYYPFVCSSVVVCLPYKYLTSSLLSCSVLSKTSLSLLLSLSLSHSQCVPFACPHSLFIKQGYTPLAHTHTLKMRSKFWLVIN